MAYSRPDTAGRPPPHDLDAEAAVLSALILQPEAFHTVAPILRIEHFYSDANGRVYEAIGELAATGVSWDIVTIASWLRDRDRLAPIGGPAYLATLADATPAVAHVETHARLVREKWRLRNAIAQCQRIAVEGYGDVGDLQTWLDAAHAAIGAVADEQIGRRGVRPIGEAAHDAITTMLRRADGRELPIPTPWKSVNAKLRGGIWPGLYTLTSATGTGKTQWAIQCAVEAARYCATEARGERVRYIALELGEVDMVARVLAALVGQEARWSDLLYGSSAESILAAADSAGSELRSMPLDIDTPDALGWTYRDLARIGDGPRPPKLVVLDYSQLVGAPPEVRAEIRETIGNVAKVARDLARRRGIAVLALSSTARSNYDLVSGSSEGERRTPPGQGDAGRFVGLGKESGELEFTADVVLALAREPETPEQVSTRKPNEARKVWLAIAKGRGFPTGWAPLWWDGTRFFEPGNHHDHPTPERRQINV